MENRSVSDLKKSLKTTDNDVLSCKESSDGRYTLCYTEFDQSDPKNIKHLIKFAVLDNQTDKRIYEGSCVGGYVKWVGATQIEYYSPPGIVPDGKSINDYIKIYDISTQSERTKSTKVGKKSSS